MRGFTSQSLALFAALPFALAACGDDGGSAGDDDPTDHDAADHDARPTIDGPPGPDAEPPPDAPAGAFDCIGDPLPSTAVDPLVLSGNVETVDLGGTSPVENATVRAFDANDQQIASDTSDATGAYTLSVATGGQPVDGYVEGTGPAGPGYKVTYVYPPYPLAESQDNVPVLLITNGTFDLLELASGQTQDDANGWIGVQLTDCLGNPVAGATVTTTPASGAVVYAGENRLPDTSLTSTSAAGLAYIFNVPPVAVTVDASAGGNNFLDNQIDVRAGVITTTVVTPGPVTLP